MPILLAHGASQLPLSQHAELLIKPSLSQPLCSHAQRSLRKSQSSLKRHAHMLMPVPVMLMRDAHGANLLLSRLLAEPWLKLNLSQLLSSHATRYTKRFQFNLRKLAPTMMRTPAMPIPLAHGANLLLLRLNATLSRMLRNSQLLFSHAPRLTSSISQMSNAKVYQKTIAMLISAHGASQLLSNQHAETQQWLPNSHLLYSNAPTYQLKRVKKKRRKTQASEDSSPECSNMERNIKIEDITEVVKINQKDVMEDMVDQVNMVITEDMEVMEDPRDMEDMEITEDMEDMMERSMDIVESIVNKVDTVK